MVVLRSKNEIEGLRRAGDLVARALVLLLQHVRAGVRLAEFDRIVAEFIRSESGEPPYKDYRPSPSVPLFPGTICTAVNEEIAHGIPGPRRLRDGDIVGMEGLPDRFDDHEEEIRALVALNQEFHGTIIEASRNNRLERPINRTVEILLMFKAFFWYTPHEWVISNHYHRQILKASEKGDADRAEIILREHVYEGRDFVIGAPEEDMNG